MKLSSLLVCISVFLPRSVSGQANTTATAAPAVNTTTPVATPPPTLPETAPPVPSCTSSADCADGQFCSSLANRCEVLSCVNWAAGTPQGETSFSEDPCVAEGAEEGTTFCGWDGSCYEYTCDNWYRYGPVAFTGFDINNPVELACEDYNNGAAENMNSVVFGCRPYQPRSKAPEAKTWTHFFNQKCHVKPRGSDSFTCYQNRANTNYQDFLGEVSRINQNSCDREIYENEQPLYWYIVQVQQDRKGTITKYKHGRDNTASTNSFDQSVADKTMFAELFSSDDAPPQPVPAPTDGEGSAAAPTTRLGRFGLMLWASMAVAAAGIGLLQ